MDSARKQKNTTLKDLRNINRILEKVKEGENKVVVSRVAGKKEMCVIGVSDASYKQDESSVVEEMIIIGNVNEKWVAPIFWKSGVIWKVCTSPKAAETRGVMKIVDDATNVAENWWCC